MLGKGVDHRAGHNARGHGLGGDAQTLSRAPEESNRHGDDHSVRRRAPPAARARGGRPGGIARRGWRMERAAADDPTHRARGGARVRVRRLRRARAGDLPRVRHRARRARRREFPRRWNPRRRGPRVLGRIRGGRGRLRLPIRRARPRGRRGPAAPVRRRAPRCATRSARGAHGCRARDARGDVRAAPRVRGGGGDGDGCEGSWRRDGRALKRARPRRRRRGRAHRELRRALRRGRRLGGHIGGGARGRGGAADGRAAEVPGVDRRRF